MTFSARRMGKQLRRVLSFRKVVQLAWRHNVEMENY